MKRFVALSMVAIGLLSVTACGGGPKTIASVNGETITDEEFLARVQDVDAVALQASAERRGPAKAGEFAMQQLITEKILQQIAKEKGVAPAEADIKELVAFAKKYPNAVSGPLGPNPFRSEQATLREARLQLIVRGLAVKPLNITQADLEKKYEQIKERLVEPAAYHLRMVECLKESDIREAADQLAKGLSFETVAMQKTVNPATKGKNGDVGTIPEPALPPAMAAAVRQLKAGQFTKEPIKVTPPTQPGQPAASPIWTLLQVVDIKPARTLPLNEVRMQIEGGVLEEKDPQYGQRVAGLVQEFTKKAKIEVTLKGYEELADRMKQVSQVGDASAPAAPAPGQPGR